MSQHLFWLLMNDGVVERITADHIDPGEEARIIDRVLMPITDSEVGAPHGKSSGYTVVGEVSGKYALLRLLDEGAPVADIAVCLHSRAAPGLWRRLWPRGPDDDSVAVSYDNRPGNPPWCAVRCYAPDQALPQAFDSWTQTLAFALVRRQGW